MELEGVMPDTTAPMLRRLYNDKEWHEETGWLEFKFRHYDPMIGRFTGIDPVSEKFAHVSPFNYAENRPIDGIDLWGLQYFNATSRFGLVGAGDFKSYEAYIHINRHYYPQTRGTLRLLKLQARGFNDDKLYDSDIQLLSDISPDSQWSQLKGKGQMTKTSHRFPVGNIAVLLIDYLDKKNREIIRNDFFTTKDHYIALENSIKIVTNAREMQLIPDELNNLDLINYILDSSVPENITAENKKNLIDLGKWLFDNKESILKNELPTSSSGDIYDTGYPLDKFKKSKPRDDGKT